MYTKLFSSAALVLAASTVVSAQTFTLCDPTKKDCPPDPAIAGVVSYDLGKGEPKESFKALEGTKIDYDAGKGAVFSIKSEGDAPTMASHGYIFFGRLDVTLQAAPGAGIVTSLVLQSDDLDEIDYEWVGGDDAQVQTNYFSKGDTTTYDRGAYHAVSTPTGSSHKYSIDWTKDRIQWLVDDKVVRTLTYAEAKGGSTYPQTPMQVKFGTWVAGKKDASEGTVQWAGGFANFANAPFNAYYKDIKVTDYAGGVQGAKQYIYSDRSGTWQSITIDTVNGGTTAGNTTSDSSSASPSKTGTAATTMATASRPGNATGLSTAGSPTPTSSSSGPVPTSGAGKVFGAGQAAAALMFVAGLFLL